MSSAGIADGIDGPNSFVPSLDTGGRNAVISAGQGLIKGQLWRADAPVSTPIPAASAQNRLDILALQLNRGATSSPAVVAPVVITGTPSGTPTLPLLTQTPTGIYQIPISNWLATSAGGLTTLVDQRQYSGRSIVMMTSAWHPSPVSPCLGFETDTGFLWRWDGSAWHYVNANQNVNGGPFPQTINTTAAATVAGTTMAGVVPGTYKVTAEAQFTGGAGGGNPSFQIGMNFATSSIWGNGYILQADGTGAGAARDTVNLTGLVFTGPGMVSGAHYTMQISGTIVATGSGAMSVQAFTSAGTAPFTVNNCIFSRSPS
jgi:hypothetical protein